MPSISVELNNVFKKIVDFKDYNILYHNIDIENFDGNDLEFTFGDPNLAAVDLRVKEKCAVTRDNRPLVGTLYGRTISGTATVNISIW